VIFALVIDNEGQTEKTALFYSERIDFAL